MIEASKVPSDLRFFVVQLYEIFISKFRSIEAWLKEINCNIGVKQVFPLSPTLFGIYIDKLEDCLEVAGCFGPPLASIVIIFLLYVHDIVRMEKNPYCWITERGVNQ
jgi:hypothetical protein